jgi:glycerol uptake facilitator protein
MTEVSQSRRLAGEMIAEAIAMFIIIAFGDSAACMYTLYTPSPYQQAYWGVCIAWGLAVTIAIYVTGGVSGAHANPAVSLAFAVFRGFSWKKVIPYCLAQVGGAFLGAAVVYSMFSPVIDHYNAINHLTRAGDGGAAGVFFTHPGLAVTPIHALWDQVILTALLMVGIFAVTEERNQLAPKGNTGPLIIGLLVATIGASAGYLEAWALNPARDFGPRLLAWLLGWGAQAFPSPGNYWWVPIVGPLLGGVIGAGVHHYLVRPFLPSRFAPTPLPEPSTVPNP